MTVAAQPTVLLLALGCRIVLPFEERMALSYLVSVFRSLSKAVRDKPATKPEIHHNPRFQQILINESQIASQGPEQRDSQRSTRDEQPATIVQHRWPQYLGKTNQIIYIAQHWSVSQLSTILLRLLRQTDNLDFRLSPETENRLSDEQNTEYTSKIYKRLLNAVFDPTSTRCPYGNVQRIRHLDIKPGGNSDAWNLQLKET